MFVIATCGLVYELIAGTLASYLLGDTVTQFSIVIGVYLSAMGVGSYLSGKVERDLLALFVRVEILIGLVGGFSAAVLFLLFGAVASFRIPLFAVVAVVGVLVGVEIPLLLRILQGRFAFKDLVARVFSFDYIGALFASLLFPLGAGAASGPGALRLPVRHPERGRGALAAGHAWEARCAGSARTAPRRWRPWRRWRPASPTPTASWRRRRARCTPTR